jgi:hypothetical protein
MAFLCCVAQKAASAAHYLISIAGHRHRDQCCRHRYSGTQHLSPVPEHSVGQRYTCTSTLLTVKHVHTDDGVDGDNLHDSARPYSKQGKGFTLP